MAQQEWYQLDNSFCLQMVKLKHLVLLILLQKPSTACMHYFVWPNTQRRPTSIHQFQRELQDLQQVSGEGEGCWLNESTESLTNVCGRRHFTKRFRGGATTKRDDDDDGKDDIMGNGKRLFLPAENANCKMCSAGSAIATTISSANIGAQEQITTLTPENEKNAWIATQVRK